MISTTVVGIETSVGASVAISVRVGSGVKVDFSGISTRGVSVGSSVGSAVTIGSDVAIITSTFR